MQELDLGPLPPGILSAYPFYPRPRSGTTTDSTVMANRTPSLVQPTMSLWCTGVAPAPFARQIRPGDHPIIDDDSAATVFLVWSYDLESSRISSEYIVL